MKTSTLVLGAVLIGGGLLIYKATRAGAAAYKCPVDNLIFPSQAALDAHTASAHGGHGTDKFAMGDYVQFSAVPRTTTIADDGTHSIYKITGIDEVYYTFLLMVHRGGSTEVVGSSRQVTKYSADPLYGKITYSG